jgi:hypothetical protein
MHLLLDEKRAVLAEQKAHHALMIQQKDLLDRANVLLIDHIKVTKSLTFAINALKYIAGNSGYGLHDDNTKAALSALNKLTSSKDDEKVTLLADQSHEGDNWVLMSDDVETG